MKRAAVERLYVPKFCENREATEKEQVTVDVSMATIKEREVFSKIKMKKGGAYEMDNRQYTALRKKVTKINNYFDDKGSPIDTAEKLISDMEIGAKESIDLCGELWNVIMGYDVAAAEESEDTEEFTEGED